MATIDNHDYILRIISHNGAEYPDEPSVTKIVEYINNWGRKTWGVVFENERNQNRYDNPTEFIHSPRVIWRREVARA
jgi:hypothetical protein